MCFWFKDKYNESGAKNQTENSGLGNYLLSSIKALV